MHVRPLSPDDRQPLAKLLEAIDEFSPEEVSCALELADLALSDRAGYRALIAEQDGQLAGYLNFGPTPLAAGTFDLYWIATAVWARGHGAGRALVAAMEAELKAERARLVRVETSSLNEYEPARTFYDRMRYQPIARIEGFYRPGDDLVVLAKRLDR